MPKMKKMTKVGKVITMAKMVKIDHFSHSINNFSMENGYQKGVVKGNVVWMGPPTNH